jgi:hypothetical protein
VVERRLHEDPPAATHRTLRSMAKASGLAPSTIHRIWREHGLKPHRVETFTLSNDLKFVAKVRDIVGNNAADQDALTPLLDAVAANTKATPAELSADSGSCSEANLADLARRGIRGYVTTGRAKHPDGGEDQRRGPLVSAMRLKLRGAGRRSRYRLRKQVVEPVFGQIKGARGFRQFLLRGLEKVKHEWALVCTAHNLTKLEKVAAA